MVDASALKDPWARPYRYQPSATGYLLAALSEGGQPIPAQTIERSFGEASPPPAPPPPGA
jgi:hypothetical protein